MDELTENVLFEPHSINALLSKWLLDNTLLWDLIC